MLALCHDVILNPYKIYHFLCNTNICGKVMPLWIHALDERYFPCPIPFFQLLLTGDGMSESRKAFIINKVFHAVTAGKSTIYARLVLGYATGKIIGHANV